MDRVLNDLVLWEPTAPAPLDVTEGYSLGKGQGWSLNTVSPFVQNQHIEMFSLCKSGIQYGEYNMHACAHTHTHTHIHSPLVNHLDFLFRDIYLGMLN